MIKHRARRKLPSCEGKKMNQVVIELIQQWLETKGTSPDGKAKREEAITKLG